MEITLNGTELAALTALVGAMWGFILFCARGWINAESNRATKAEDRCNKSESRLDDMIPILRDISANTKTVLDEFQYRRGRE
jgi:hypothetical protein